MYCYINVQDTQVGHTCTTVSLSCLLWNSVHLLEKIEAPLTLVLGPGASIRENTVVVTNILFSLNRINIST